MRNAGLLAIHGAPEGPQDLFNHNRLLLKFPGSPPCRWTFRTPEVPLTLPVQGRMDADDGDTLFRWALAGSFLSPFLKLPTASRPPAYWNPFCRLSHRSRQALAVVYPHKRLLPTRVKLLIESPVQEIAKAHAGINPDLFAAALMGIAKRFMRTNESETTSAAKFDPEPRLADHTYARDVFRARCKLPMDDAPPRRVA
jgi:hypothetical protein